MQTEFIGEEVIGIASQSLTAPETRLVVGLAEGEPIANLSKVLNTPVPMLRSLETSAQNKLGARSRGHLITRAFLLGVLRPRAIEAAILLTAILCAFGSLLAYRYQSQHQLDVDVDAWAGQIRGAATQDPRYNGKRFGH